MAPLGRILAQVIVPIIATLARAIPAAYSQAVQRAKQGGVSAAAQSSTTPFARRLMPKEEALLVLNIPDTDVTPERVEQQYQRYFAANSMEKGGSFYLQSKVYRAKEMLDAFLHEQNTAKQTTDQKP